MELKLWHTIVSACGQVRVLLDRALPSTAADARASDATIVFSQPVAVLKTMRDDIRTRLDELRGELADVLSEREVYQVLFPLTIHYDELVLRRLSPTEQTAWPLLQSERYGINDGGDVFYSFVDDRLATSDTAPLVFEVLYFCLSDGFIGRYANDSTKIAAYKSKLAARIPTPRTPATIAAKKGAQRPEPSNPGHKRKHDHDRDRDHGPRHSKGHGDDEKTSAAGKKGHRAHNPVANSTLRVALFYGATAAVVLLLPLVLVWLSNL